MIHNHIFWFLQIELSTAEIKKCTKINLSEIFADTQKPAALILKNILHQTDIDRCRCASLFEKFNCQTESLQNLNLCNKFQLASLIKKDLPISNKSTT